MSTQHQRVAWDVIGLETPLERLVLLAYAKHACQWCGLCWPGKVRLELMCIAGHTSIATTRQSLIAKGLLRIHAYPRGGRGMSTEMVVLPNDLKLSTAPCGKCGDNLKTNRHAAGIGLDGVNEPVDNS